MRILFVTEFFPTGKSLRFSGGVEARTLFVTKNLAIRHKVTVIAARTRGTPYKERLFGFDIYRIGPVRDYTASVGHLISRIRFIKDAIKFAKTLDIEIVDGGNYIAHFIARKIADYKRIPVVAWYPDVWLNEWIRNAGMYGIFGEILERYNLSRAFDAYIAISKETTKKLKKYARSKVFTIYCGADPQEFKVKISKFKDPTILCVSRLTKYKNIKTLIFAFAHLSTKIKDAKLIIVGDSPQKRNLLSLSNNLNISQKVQFLNNLPRQRLIELYQSSHIFSLPSIVEGFGIATIEAAACGLPYVNSDTPIQREITRGGKGGYLVDSLNPIAYSQIFEKLFKNEEIYQRKSREAKILAQNYDWRIISQATEKIYLSLVKNH